ncbi:hypothetical protein CBR_g3365 [Chara braunii]|uniref:Leucine-rich repeat-containing protein 51 n=1 Tax=Chara braunii TaxID=69332 RepID=A0A388JQR1_CHABU|nr:hypothetical protein CBR_g3365 [Chara braunii]|eukprot:GBG60121.1 hypothetical protein CBR_g3365 [Chara braunii]
MDWRKVKPAPVPSHEYLPHGPPVDFSFKELKDFAELFTEEPLSGTRKAISKAYSTGSQVLSQQDTGWGFSSKRKGHAVGSSSTRESMAGSTVTARTGRTGGGGKSSGRLMTATDQRLAAESQTGKSTARTLGGPIQLNSICVRVNNNELQTWENFEEAMESVLDDATKLSWIDLSHNHLTQIDDVITKYKDLTVVYLHGNSVLKMTDVYKLAALPRLQKLTLHGNPIEEVPFYRTKIIGAIRTLKELDFTAITKVDRDRAYVDYRNRAARMLNRKEEED